MALSDTMYKFSALKVIMDDVFHAWVIKPGKSEFQFQMCNNVCYRNNPL